VPAFFLFILKQVATMKKLIPSLVLVSLLAPATTFAAGPFEEKDFTFDPFNSLYKRVIVSGVNKLARENPNCATLDPATLIHDGGTPDDPEFTVTCGEPGHETHPHFSKTDITGDPSSNVPLDEKDGQGAAH
jgi:hypothetical protein